MAVASVVVPARGMRTWIILFKKDWESLWIPHTEFQNEFRAASVFLCSRKKKVVEV